MKITDMIISAVLKKGVLYEAHKCDVEFEVPMSQINADAKDPNQKIMIRFKAENMSIRIEKE